MRRRDMAGDSWDGSVAAAAVLHRKLAAANHGASVGEHRARPRARRWCMDEV